MSMFLGYGKLPNIVQNGLVLYLDAGTSLSYRPDVSGTTWKDLSGNNNHAVLNGPVFNSVNGGVFSFDGTNDYAIVSNNVTSGTNDFTVSVWVYKTNVTNNLYIWDFGSNNGGTLSSGTSVTQGFRYYNPTIGIGSPLYTSGPLHTINTWYNIVISRISGTTYFYSNNSLIVSATDGGNIGSWGTVLTIGVASNLSGGWHVGYIGSLMVYKNKGLTSTEVAQNFNATKARFGL